MVSPAPWESKFHRAIVIGQWVALSVGVISDFVGTGGAGQSFGALVAAGAYVVGTTIAPPRLYRARFGVESITLLGALLVLVALTLTGGPDSPYLLLSMGPSIFATIYGGLRAGFMTGLLSTALLTLVTIARDVRILDAAPALALYSIFVLLVGVIRRLLRDIHQQATELAKEKASATQRLERLEAIHGALMKLSEDVSAGRLNAIEVGADTLDMILDRFPRSAGKLAVHGDSGLVVLAARGIPEETGHTQKLPLLTSDADIGILELITPERLTAGELNQVADLIRPVAIAFANLQLLQDIVGSAVAEERTRLARELHDEIGPSLASLGLALDMTVMQQSDQPDIAADLQVLRSNVTKLVEDVRASVADLRTAPGPTLTARILKGTANLSGEPPIIVDLDERRPPRAPLIADLTSIITEAARNAYKHSNASKIVISGRVDRNFGSCSVVDDGLGFVPDHEPDGHYGLIGMRERAARIGAEIKIDSKPGVGAAVTVEWGSK